MPMQISQGRDLGDWPLYMQPIDGTTQVIKSGIVIVIAETRLMFHTKLWCMAISKAVAAKKREHESELGTYLTHIDGTSIEALKSSKIPSNNTTGVRGVYCVKGRYKAKIVFQKKQFSLGTYDTLAEAATARKKAEKMLKSDVIAFYEQWTAKAAANPAWAKENPIHFQVTKNEAGELELQLAPKLDPETH